MNNMENKKLTGVELIAEERKRQIDVEGWTAEHDAGHTRGELAIAAACYAIYGTDANVQYPGASNAHGWPWEENYWKVGSHLENLIKAGALIAADIDRELNKRKPTQP